MIQDSPSILSSSESLRDLAATLPSPPVSPRRDSEFYCRDVVFRVEETLFRVSRRPFEDNTSAFQTMFSLPSLDHARGAEGTSDDHPIRIQGVTEDEFRALLYVLFPTSYGVPRTLTKDQWMSALKLATMWNFEGVRDKAIAELRRLVPEHAERIRLARLFDIPGWIETALNELAQQDSLTAAELQALGWDTAAKLIKMRENVAFSGACMCGCNYCTIAHGQAIHTANPSAGMRSAMLTATSLRRSMDFTSQIKELFAGELF
ncbi:hypothetical protein BD414DRAFT_524925 [Trametes punicea]|nr:hypothetical protein BD414DRAFT_524925 [Trametes punicea]